MKVVFQHQGLITDEYKSFFNDNVPEGLDLIFAAGDESLLAHTDADVFVGYSLKKEFVEQASNLRHIQIPWTGFNNLGSELLDGKNNITVSNSHSNSLAIAEHAVSLLFSAAKLIPYRDAQMRKGDWSTRRKEVDSFWITGRKLGIIGYGAIGKKVASMLKPGFAMEVLAIKRNPDEKDEICDFLGGMNDLEKVLAESDFIVVATPLTEETRGMLGEKEFDLMKNTAVLVNIGRGPIIDEKALYDALKEGKISAAGIDTWYNYPSNPNAETFQNYPFEELQNMVMTPHSAFKVRDRVEEFAQDILTNIIRIYQGQEPINQVNLDIGY